jgi:phosphoribosylformylglycinamidine cyclo-ligase
MCVNDVITSGAKPLFFLDYRGINKVNSQKIKQIIKGIAGGCKDSRCALLGGEIAELKDLYKKDEYDLAGFAVGIIKKNKIINGSKINPGNIVIGLPFSGLHSNGYTLIRMILKENKISVKGKLGKEILKPTKIYTDIIMHLVDKLSILGIAHITGGRLGENIKRILPKGCSVLINKDSWQIPPIFKKIQRLGGISSKEMYKVFNMRIGMVVIVSKKDLPKVKRLFKNRKEKFYMIGKNIKQANNIVNWN